MICQLAIICDDQRLCIGFGLPPYAIKMVYGFSQKIAVGQTGAQSLLLSRGPEPQEVLRRPCPSYGNIMRRNRNFPKIYMSLRDDRRSERSSPRTILLIEKVDYQK
ncbi:hypothetical protein TNCV_1428121 [Trichonephila clavipes]|nr:hypothetical protein TNCV_1428121 [Trichonephila clavipes]